MAPFVRCVWTLTGPAASERAPQPVVPDGCMELILNFGDPFDRHRLDGSFVERQPLDLIVGPSTGPAVIVPTGAVDLIGVRLQPWGAAALLGIEPAALRDALLPMRDVNGAVASSMASVRDGHDVSDRLQRLRSALEPLATRAKAPDPALRAVIALLDTTQPTSSVRDVAARVGRSVRWVQRGFEREVGLSPKMVGRIARTQRALRIADRFPSWSWGAVAAAAGYFDQSHLVRDFRQIVGYAPAELALRAGELTDVFREGTPQD